MRLYGDESRGDGDGGRDGNEHGDNGGDDGDRSGSGDDQGDSDGSGSGGGGRKRTGDRSRRQRRRTNSVSGGNDEKHSRRRSQNNPAGQQTPSHNNSNNNNSGGNSSNNNNNVSSGDPQSQGASFEVQLLTICEVPPRTKLHVGGVVMARSVKYLGRVKTSKHDLETRDTWWIELREEVRRTRRNHGTQQVREGICAPFGSAIMYCFTFIAICCLVR